MDVEVPAVIENRVRLAYGELDIEEPQPVEKIALHIYRIDEMLMIDEVTPLEDGEGGGGNGGQQAGGPQNLLTLLARIDRLERNDSERHRQLVGSVTRVEHTVVTHSNRTNNNIRRFGGTIEGAFVAQRGNGAQRRGAGGGGAEAGNAVNGGDGATLCHNPRTLMELWREWKHGVDGRKPAEQFTSRERNNRTHGMKQKYYRRMLVWKLMDRFVRGGDTPQAAANKIRSAYGYQLSVTQIINFMIRDNRTGGHPNLR
jgi:hypothetical protein